MRMRTLLPFTTLFVYACSGVDSTSPQGSGGSSATDGGAGNTGGSAATGVTTGGVAATGGSSNATTAAATGGLSATGGSVSGPLGGANATGGTAASPTGGSKAAGGVASTGGAPATGGSLAVVGGAPSTGGTKAGGGASATGGSATVATGGKSTVGGSSATGGSKATTGGALGTGGVAPTGGAKGTGGGTSTGSCVESTCGSHKWACWKMPNPASNPATPNHQNYTDLGNGAVRDNISCLVWEKANPSAQGNWQTSFNRCASLASSNYAGFNDWRLPTRVEMASICDLHGSTGFPTIFTTTSGYYTTGSDWYETITGQNTSGYIWGYGTNGFTSNAIAGTGTNLVARCVRGNGTGEAVDAFAVEPANHYTIASGEVTDNYTGLIWQQAFSDTMDHPSAVTYCSTLALNGHSWRVPTLNELASTVNEALVGGAINRTAFPNNPNGCKAPEYWFWAAEAYYTGTNAFWGLSYCDGFTGGNVGASGDWNYFPTARVRCVR